jgi:type III restriction enzyme
LSVTSATVTTTDDALLDVRREFGLEPFALAALRSLCDRHTGLRQVWVFGSRARGDWRERSDIDLAVDAPEWTSQDFSRFEEAIKQLPIVYLVDAVLWNSVTTAQFRAQIERDRKVFWEPSRQRVSADEFGSTQLKKFQVMVLESLDSYIAEINKHAVQSLEKVRQLRAMEGMEEYARKEADFPKRAWDALQATSLLPVTFRAQPHSSRFDGAGNAIPNVCLKVPTGGGKTLLAAASIGRVFSNFLNRHTGLVLWVVPNEAIYQQTLKTLNNRDHPYRQMLNVAAAGRVKILEKSSPLTKQDTDSHLCVMLLMLQSAARQSKETLRFFRDRGSVHGFVPREDDIEAHWDLLLKVPNLDVYSAFGTTDAEARAQKGSIIKSSLGNVMRLLRPMVVIDEGHHAYSQNALSTIDGFNPSFMLELSATPRVSGVKAGKPISGSNILVDVRGTDLDEAEMIKLPINVSVSNSSDWKNCLAASVTRLNELAKSAAELQAETLRYLRPILLVQVERTGKDMRDAGLIHAEDAKAYLLQIGFTEAQIAIKTSEKNELKQPENIDLLSPACEVRVIITKQALQEGWDCPFAYVLCALAAGRNPAAMTQLVGRILRQPHVTKTGRADLDACYVLCHDARTGEVVSAIKKSLESEGMGDLAITVTGDVQPGDLPKVHKLTRRPEFAQLRIFVPKVTWVDASGGVSRRELVYESDVLSRLDWNAVNANSLAVAWAPGQQSAMGSHFSVDLSILNSESAVAQIADAALDARVDRARLVRGVLDIAPNAWQVWAWIDAVVNRLVAVYAEHAVAASSDSLLERLRVDIEKERDRMAERTFESLVSQGQIEFRLRADATDYELPQAASLELTGKPDMLVRSDGYTPVSKSLLTPALRSGDMDGFEAQFAGYIDEKAALKWWHRNVAKTQYGLQGWRRHRVYPDFVFGLVSSEGKSEVVLMETKGLHLAGSSDTTYKEALLNRLSQAFVDERVMRVGDLVLHGIESQSVSCDLIFEDAWRGQIDQRYFDMALCK